VNYPVLLAFTMLFLHLKSLGFNYNFNSLSGENELMKAFSAILKAGQKPSVIPILKAMSPALRFLVRISIVASQFYLLNYIWLQPAPNDAVTHKAAAAMNRIARGLLEQSKGDKSLHRKDVLSVLTRANTTEEEAHQMKDEDVMSRA
jgi:hypothetical protein